MHVDIKYLPQMQGEAHRHYLFVAIDRATRRVYLRTHPNQSEVSSTNFLRRLKRAAPMVINKLFTNRLTSADKQARGNHAFDIVCTELGIEHRLESLRHAADQRHGRALQRAHKQPHRTNKISCAAELDSSLKRYLTTYNHSIPQRDLHHQTPIQALKSRRENKPALFVNRIHDQAGLDT